MLLNRRTALQTLGAGLVSSLAAPYATAQKRRPNVLILVADDLGYGDVGCYGSRDVLTPNIDSIAKNGVRFTDGYVSCAVCSPSRAALLTGRYQQRFGHEYNTGPAARDREKHLGLPLDQITLPQLLKQQGYSTGMVGKWHLGMNPEFHPMSRGFDEYFGFLFGANNYAVRDTPGAKGLATDDVPAAANLLVRRREPIFRGRDEVEETRYLTDAFGQEAVSYIDRHKSDKNPFFLYLAFNAVHTPLQATERYLDRYANIKDPKHRMLAAMTSAMDDAIGGVLGKLRAEGLDKDTAVFFLSDNGCPTYTKAGTNGPLNGSKITYYEGGIRVPFCAQLPGVIKPGQVYHQPMVSRDLFPTIMNLAGGKLPTDREYDGVDLMPYIQGKNKSAPHDKLFWRSGPNSAMRDGNMKLIQTGDKTHLYDLAADIGEKNNIAAKHADRVKKMTADYDAWNAKNIAPKWDPVGKHIIPINDEQIEWCV